MMAGWRRRWLPAFIVLMLALGLLSVFGLARDIGRPYGGFFAYFQVFTGRWQMDSVTPRWWPALAKTGLAYSDRLARLNGLPYAFNQAEVYAAAYARGDPEFSLEIDRDQTVLARRLPVALFSWTDFLDVKVPPFVAGLGFWLLAVVIYRSRPTDNLNRVFAFTAGLIASYQWILLQTVFNSVGLIEHIIQVGWILTVPFLGAAFFHCATLFPTPVRWNARPILIGWYALSALAVACYLVSRMLLWTQGYSAVVAQLDFIGFYFATVSIAVGMLSMIVRLLTTYVGSRSTPRVRRQLTPVIIGLAFTAAITTSALYGALGGVTLYFWQGFDLRYLYLALPLAIGYSIVRYQTFRSEPSPLFMFVIILISSAMLASFGDALAFLLQPQLTHSLFAPIFIVALIAGALWSSQGVFPHALRRVFYWEDSSYSAVRQFGHTVITRPNTAPLPQTIVEALVTELKVERAVIWLSTETGADLQLAAHAGRSVVRLPDRLALPPGRLKPMRVEDVGLSSLARYDIEALAPLAGSEQLIGVLGLGRRWDEELFHDRDLEIVELIAQQAALFLVTAQQIDELRQVPRRVTEAQERERFKIAQELHDTIQQFLGRLPFFLEVSRSAAYDDPGRADELLQRSITDVEQAAKTVRQIRANLAPFQLQTGFVQPVQDLVERFRARQQIETRLTVAPDLDQALSLDARHALYRVVQQALDNAAAHAQAQQISISLARVDQRVTFEIVDDGLGSAETDRAQAAARGSFGLKSMRDRIESQGGAFEFVSSPGQGTAVRGWVLIKHTTTN